MTPHCTRAALLVIAILCRVSTAEAQGPMPQGLSTRDTAIIEEAYHLWSSVADNIWPGAARVPIPLVYITQENEYAVGFLRSLEGFTTSAKLGSTKVVQVRRRTLNVNLSASFDVAGISAAVMGCPEALNKTSGEWVITAAHEMFHVFQAARGGQQKVAALEIGPTNDASWQLNLPFPYKDADVMRLIHLQGYPLWLAVTNSDLADAKYNLGTALDAARVYRAYLDRLAPEGRLYRYSEFQEWNEGVAAYTEYRVADAAAHGTYHPTEAFAALTDFSSYQRVWEQAYQGRIFLLKHAGRAAQSRTAFYHLGMGKALALDKVNPNWKDSYFAAGVWLDDLIAAAVEPSK